MSSIEKGIRNVSDTAFLHDYFEPTLVILYETVQTWTGRLAARRDTKSLIAISLDLTQRNYPVLFRVTNLPYNCTMLLPVPSPVGGVLVFSPNSIIYIDQTCIPGVVCAVNSYYGMESHFPPPPTLESGGAAPHAANALYGKSRVSDFKHLGFSLEGCVPYFLNPDSLLLVLRSGELVIVELVGDEDVGTGWKRRKSGVRKFNVKKFGLRAVLPSCGTKIGGVTSLRGDGAGDGDAHAGHVFIGSRVGDSLLLQFTETAVMQVEDIEDEEKHITSPKSATTSKLLDEIDEDIYGDADDMPLPGSSAGALSSNTGPRLVPYFRFRITDFLLSTAPIRDAVLGEPTVYSNHAFTPDTARSDLEIVTCAGEGVWGGLGVLQQNVRPVVRASFDMPDVNEIWSVGYRRTLKEAALAQEKSADEGVEEVKAEDGDTNMTPANGAPIEGSSQAPETTEINTSFSSAEEYELYDKFILMSKETGTAVFESGNELRETDDTEFRRDGPTVGVGMLLDDEVYVQVHLNGIIILAADGKRLEELPIGGQERWIVSCSILDPYILVLINTNEVALFIIDAHEKTLSTLPPLAGSPISACCLYCDDLSGKLLPTTKEYEAHLARSGVKFLRQRTASMLGDMRMPSSADLDVNGRKRKRDTLDVDGTVDADLYGDDDTPQASPVGRDIVMGEANGGTSADGEAGSGTVHAESSTAGHSDSASAPKKRFWCFIYRENGTLEICSIPDFEQVFYFPHFDLVPPIAHDHYAEETPSTQTQVPANNFSEILVVNLGRDALHKDPYLIARTADADLIIYKIYAYLDPSTATSPSRLAIRLLRIPHSHISRPPKSYTDTEGDKLHVVPSAASTTTHLRKHHLKPFRNVGTKGGRIYDGVFVCGERPCWIMCSGTGGTGPSLEVLEDGDGEKYLDERGGGAEVCGKRTVRVHPCVVDGGIRGFASMHNASVENGFVYVNSKNLLRLCTLPPHFVYDAHWPYCKVPMRRAPQCLTYHETTKTYVVATSTNAPFKLSRAKYTAAVSAGVIEDGEEMPESEDAKRNAGVKDEDRDPGMYWPQISAYAMELVSPVTWETVDAIPLDEHEHILCMQSVYLDSKETASGKKQFLAIGTGFVRGEDLATRGRIFVYDIIDVVPEPERPQTTHRFKQKFVNEEKGPVTALCNVGRYLVAAIGSKIIIHSFEDDDSLTGVAFLDVNMYVHSICAIKNLILVSDIMKSVWFLGFQEEPPKLVLLGKDYHAMRVYASEFLIDDQMLAFLVGDEEMNLHVLTYAPYNIQSSSGQKLIRRGDFHAGQHVSKLMRVKRAALKGEEGVPKQHLCVFVTLEGGVGLTTPVSEKLYKRMYGLYSRMVNNLQHGAGLNPRGFRQVSARARPLTAAFSTATMGPPGPRAVLDGDLLYQFAGLGVSQQNELAKGIGSRIEKILDDLVEVWCGAEYF
ncbi:Cleavage and polyadenylation specificity factor subunit 1 [Rhizophlyctis rosea]|uniref:Cleavage and polyadenylation specificity factor subunit 1 n=1 Tax=Rhizophlyctis rosea TaxID=64517 RepID=A0AAD5SHG3_9FUNG|nr:Cleavage and polyadenylation specificity factor subunit 1 [Rhizophlyctis rosea]